MPKLEAYQRENPSNLLRSSHVNDPRYPEMYELDGKSTLPVFSRIAGECSVSAYSIRSMNGFPGQMPDRFFLADLTSKQRTCVAAKLPEGYNLARLKNPTHPSEVEWSEDLSDNLVSSQLGT